MIHKKADFSFIRYANVWEDPRVLLEGIYTKQGSRYLSVGSSGDNTFSLLLLDPEQVVAVDISPVQLYLIELKIAAILELDQPEVLSFLGFKPSSVRKQTFDKIRFRMSEEAQQFFEINLAHWTKNGVIHSGKFERYFQYFSKYVLPMIHSSSRIEKLFQPKTADDQKRFFENEWNSWRWKTLFRVFFSKTVMGKLGRDPQFLKEVKVKVSDFILSQAERQLSSVDAQTNPFLRYNLIGKFDDFIPHYLHSEHFEIIKSRISRIKLHLGYAEDAIQHFGTFDGMNLSNIFEYMSTDVFEQTTEKLVSGLRSGGRLVYWNLMVDRRCSQSLKGIQLHEQTDLMLSLSQKDWGYFYKTVVVDEKCTVLENEKQIRVKEEISLIEEIRVKEETWVVVAENDVVVTEKTFPDRKEINLSNQAASLTIFLNSSIKMKSSQELKLSDEEILSNEFDASKGYEKTAIFGRYFCENTQSQLGEQLLKYALNWCKEQGFESAIGPMNGTTWDTYRFKTWGHRNFLGDLPLSIDYVTQWRNVGFKTEAKYVSTQVQESKIERFEQRKNQLESLGLIIRNLELENWNSELDKIYNLSLEAFKNNAFYTEIDWGKFKSNYDLVKPSLDPNWVLMAEEKNSGELIGFVFAYLDKTHQPSSLVVKTVARKEGFRWSGLGLVMTQMLHQKARLLGIRDFIHAFMHENAVSLNCSSSMKAEIIAEYELMRFKF
jgi:S-adenosylmethionine-diacylglycerol 3-amino-3-carboxypropyl transferase